MESDVPAEPVAARVGQSAEKTAQRSRGGGNCTLTDIGSAREGNTLRHDSDLLKRVRFSVCSDRLCTADEPVQTKR